MANAVVVSACPQRVVEVCEYWRRGLCNGHAAGCSQMSKESAKTNGANETKQQSA